MEKEVERWRKGWKSGASADGTTWKVVEEIGRQHGKKWAGPEDGGRRTGGPETEGPKGSAKRGCYSTLPLDNTRPECGPSEVKRCAGPWGHVVGIRGGCRGRSGGGGIRVPRWRCTDPSHAI